MIDHKTISALFLILCDALAAGHDQPLQLPVAFFGYYEMQSNDMNDALPDFVARLSTYQTNIPYQPHHIYTYSGLSGISNDTRCLME